MSTAEEISLLGYVQTPILVGDPDGCIVYANPAFRRSFSSEADGADLMGRPLAMVFGGGAREVVLSATASVLQRGEAARLQIREGGTGYTGLASPIEAQDDRVGVVMVLLEEHSGEEHLTALADEIGEPIAEALKTLHALAPQMNGLIADGIRERFERGLHALETAQRSLQELHVVLRGGKPKQGRFDVSGALMRVAERVGQDHGAGVELAVLMPPNLPRVVGGAAVFERLMGQLLRQRMDEGRRGQSMTLLARTFGHDDSQGVLVSLVDQPDATRRDTTGLPPEALSQGIAAMGGETLCVEDSEIGRVTSMRLAIAQA